MDNHSTDKSVNFLRENYPQVKIIENKKNFGFAEGNNVGIREALKSPEIKYIACLNNDTEVEQNWLAELVRAMESNHNIGLCASKILYFGERDKIDSAGDFYYHHSLKVGPRGHEQKDKGQYNQPEECLSACAAASLYRREMLEEVRLEDDFFDSDYFAYIEDSDLALRARLKGWRCIYVPKAVVYHQVSATTSKLSNLAKKYFSLKNRVFTMIKIYPISWWPKAMKNPVSYQNTDLNPIGNFWIFFKVFISLALNLSSLNKKRKIIQKNKKVSFQEIKEWARKFVI